MIASPSHGPRFARLFGRGLALLSCVGATVLVAGCGTRTQSTDSFLGFITPYRIDIVQGNAVTAEQVRMLRPGLTPQQVQAVMGTPMLADAFHGNRWDYYFSLRRPGTEVSRRVVVVHFSPEGVVERVESPDDLPDESTFVASVLPASKRAVPKLELDEAQRKALPPPQRPATSADPMAPQGVARPYPPLE
jgi:outer membrane protein assembly factor BamE